VCTVHYIVPYIVIDSSFINQQMNTICWSVIRKRNVLTSDVVHLLVNKITNDN